MHFSARLAQKQRLQMLLSPSLQKSLAILEMPIDELFDFVQMEIEQNPLLENHTSSFERAQDFIKEAPHTPSLRSQLLEKAFAVFDDSDDKHMAELILGNISSRGILENYDELRAISSSCFDKVMSFLKEWAPLGFGVKSLKQLLKELLASKSEPHPLALKMVQECFSHLAQQDFVQIGKKLGICSDTAQEIFKKEISSLTLFCLDEEKTTMNPGLQADLIIEEMDGKLTIQSPEEKFFIIPKLYHDCLDEPDLTFKERTYVRRHLADALWLKRSIDRRSKSLRLIGQYLCKEQASYLLGETLYPAPLDMKMAASELGLSLSTMSRALSKKHVFCIHGMIPLKNFFPKKVISIEGQAISQSAVLEALKQMIEKESKKKPLTDQELSVGMRKVGFRLSRRTISKYRERLRIGSSQKRKS